MSAIADFEAIKTLGFASISGAYASVGSSTDHPIRAFRLTNATQGDLFFTNDVTKDKWIMLAGTFVLYDVQSNKSNKDDKNVLTKGTQFSVKQITAPVAGDVYIECMY